MHHGAAEMHAVLGEMSLDQHMRFLDAEIVYSQ